MRNKFIATQRNVGARAALQRSLADAGYSMSRTDMDERLKALISERSRLHGICTERRSDLKDLQFTKHREHVQLDAARKSLEDAQKELELFDNGHQGAEIRELLEGDSRNAPSR